MFNQRLFWKLFLSFWAALLLFALGVLYAASAYLDSTRERYDAINPRERNETIFAEAQSAGNQGEAALKQWAKEVDASDLVPLLLLDIKGKDILGREPSLRALARLDFIIKNYASNSADKRMPVVLPDGRQLWIVPDFQNATLSRLISRPRVVATQLVLATLIGAGVCLLLAVYLTSPLKRLRAATIAYGSGQFKHRVGPSLGRRKDEIVDLARAMDTMAERIDTLLESQRNLLRDVSHELRSPLARVQVAVGLARQRVGNVADSELNRIDTEMDKLNELIGRIIDFTRLDAGLYALHLAPVRLAQIIEDVVSDTEIEAERKHIRLQTQPDYQGDIDGDPALLASAIENILRNAVRHTPHNGHIQISLQQQADEIEIAIRDEGGGIPEALLNKVFEPFFRVEDHRNPQSGGIGLGLAIAHQAVTLHGGRIELQNIELRNTELNNLVLNNPTTAQATGLEVILHLPLPRSSS